MQNIDQILKRSQSKKQAQTAVRNQKNQNNKVRQDFVEKLKNWNQRIVFIVLWLTNRIWPFCKVLFDLFIQYRMARNQTVISTVHNIFALNRFRKECYYEPIRVDFSSIQKPNSPPENILPFFNNDKLYFTPAFVLKRQKISLQENLQTEKSKFEARISHSQKANQNETPQYKPTDSKYCQLCHEYFNDYWDHINDKYHKRMINSSKFNKDIVALCESFKLKDEIKGLAKTKKIDKKCPDNKSVKEKNLKFQEKGVKQPSEKIAVSQLEKQAKQGKGIVRRNVQKIERRNVQQSLKIMLQLGNYSTNILSNNTCKQFCRGS